ncbi:MAG: DUF1269 domain-containing protein [Chloroflexia bacterium]|nr:DUF1269 domain-containing protein [Chloroflexia bacterium]
MVRLTVWVFPSFYGAGIVVKSLHMLLASELIRLDDAALLSWPRGRPTPYLKVMTELPRIWMLDDAFWGILVGALFHPERLASGKAGGGSIGEVFASLGLSPALLDSIRELVVEGTSALLLLIEPEVVRRLHTAFEGMSYTLVEAPLSTDQQQWLRSTFSAHVD